MKKLFLSLIVLTMTLTATAARPYFVGHRGSQWGVENTAEAFEQGCVRGQFDYLETDIKVTKDKVFICWHDDNTSKYGASNKTIASTNWADLKKIKHTQKRGSKTYTGYLCSMDEYLDICKKYNKRPVIELKWATGINSNDQSNMEKLVQAIKAKGFYETCIILTSMKPCLEWLHKNHPKMTLQFLTGQYWSSHFSWCKTNKIHVDIQSGSWLTKSTVTKFHDAGLKVNMWTTNSVSGYNTHKNMGCDFITTDYLEPSDFGLTAWEKKAFPDNTYTATGEADTPETPAPSATLTVSPTTDINFEGTIGQTTAAPSTTLTVKGENLTNNISVNPSNGAVIVTKESGWNDKTGGKLKVTLDINYEKGAGTHTGYIAIQSTSSDRKTINFKAVLNPGESTTPPVVTPPDESEEPAQPSAPLAGTHSMSDALWTKSASYYGFATDDNRSIAYYNDSLYVPQKSKGSFLVIDAASGTIHSTQVIGNPSFAQHNLRITTDGQMMLGNTESGETAAAKVYVYTASLLGGEMSPIGTADIGKRSDYFHIYGSWAKGGNLLALSNQGKTLIQIPFTGGATAPESQITSNDLPEGTSAKAVPTADGLSCYATVAGYAPTKHDLATGNKIDSFTGTDKPSDPKASGLSVFYLHGHTYMIVPAGSLTSGKFELFDITDGLSKAKLLYTKDPALGTTSNSNTKTIDFCTKISGNDAFIYVLVPNNGIAAYKFTFTPDETETPSTPATPDATYGSVNFHFQGGTMAVPVDNEKLWDEMGPAFDAYYPDAPGKYTTYPDTKNVIDFGRANNPSTPAANYPVTVAVWVDNAAPWKWLGDYMQANISDYTMPTTNGWSNRAYWFFSTAGFFTATVASEAHPTYGKGDWTEAGKPEKWQPAYIFAHKPTKSGATFLGWFDNAQGTGSALTKLPTSGDVYACWSGGGTTTEVEAVEKAATAYLVPTYTGVEMFFEGTQAVVVYNINGMQVAAGVATERFACDLEAGMYIIRIGQEAYKFVK